MIELYNSDYARWADIIWFEWADANAISGTQTRWPAVTVCRAHRYEIHKGLLNQVDTTNLDHIIFVSDRIKHYAENNCGLNRQCGAHVIPHGVELNRFSYRNRWPSGHKLAFVGQLNWKKGIPLLLDCFERLIDKDSDSELYIAGQFQQVEIAEYLLE